jgi:hypothetical protein
MKLAIKRETSSDTAIVMNNGSEFTYGRFDHKKKNTVKYKDISIDEAVNLFASKYENSCVDFIAAINNNRDYDFYIECIYNSIPRGRYSYKREEIAKNNTIVVDIPENVDKITKMLRNRIKYSEITAKWELSLANHRCYVIRNYDANIIIIANENHAFVIEDGILKMMSFNEFVKFIIETIERNKEKGNV